MDMFKCFLEIGADIEKLISGEAVTKNIVPELTYAEFDTDDGDVRSDYVWSVLYATGYLTDDKEGGGGKSPGRPRQEARHTKQGSAGNLRDAGSRVVPQKDPRTHGRMGQVLRRAHRRRRGSCGVSPEQFYGGVHQHPGHRCQEGVQGKFLPWPAAYGRRRHESRFSRKNVRKVRKGRQE